MGKFDGVMILSDLDDTLLGRDKAVSPQNRAAIKYFMANGGRFSLATGRSKPAMEYFLAGLPVNAPAVIYNGSVVYDFARGAPVWTCPVGEEGYLLARALMARFPTVGVEVYELDTAYVVQSSAHTRAHFEHVRLPWRACAPEEIPQPWINLLVTAERPQLAAVRAFIEESFPGQFFLQYSGPTYLEIEHVLANKGAAALRVRDWLDIDPARFYTVGDGTNDVELLSCTTRRCAPANACAEVRALAPFLLPDCDSHVIAALVAAIERGEV